MKKKIYLKMALGITLLVMIGTNICTQLYTLMYQLHIVKVIKFKSIDSLHDFHYLCCNN